MVDHRDDLAGVHQLDRVVGGPAEPLERHLEPRHVADEHELERRIPAGTRRPHRTQRASDLGARRAITAKCVYDDPHGRRILVRYSSAASFAMIVSPRY
jgi:hypothetical protein